MNFARYIFSRQCSYFDVFLMGLLVGIFRDYGIWIALSLLLPLGFISGSLTYWVTSQQGADK